MNRAHIQPGAFSDVDEAAGWYETQRTGLGIEFILEFDAAVARATESPEAYAVQYRGARRILMRRFPETVEGIFNARFTIISVAPEDYHRGHSSVSPATVSSNGSTPTHQETRGFIE